jgi:hypothetical protein
MPEYIKRPKQLPPLWHFWNPRSGIVGGLIGGALVLGIIEGLMFYLNTLG